jgi:hypothetical protein
MFEPEIDKAGADFAVHSENKTEIEESFSWSLRSERKRLQLWPRETSMPLPPPSYSVMQAL